MAVSEVTTLLLIRHGQIRANVEGRWHGATDSPLTRQGRRQVARLSRYLRRSFEQLDVLYSSPLQRCQQTAVAVAEAFGRPVVTEDDLREYGIGEWEDMPYRLLAEREDFYRRISEDLEYAPPGGDSINAVARRIVPALQRIHDSHPGARHIGIIGHGAAMAIALAALLDRDPARWPHYPLANCSVTELVLAPEPALEAFNRIEHL